MCLRRSWFPLDTVGLSLHLLLHRLANTHSHFQWVLATVAITHRSQQIRTRIWLSLFPSPLLPLPTSPSHLGFASVIITLLRYYRLSALNKTTSSSTKTSSKQTKRRHLHFKRLYRETDDNITIEFMFAGINMFWARLRLILARAATMPDKVIIISHFNHFTINSPFVDDAVRSSKRWFKTPNQFTAMPVNKPQTVHHLAIGYLYIFIPSTQ